MRDDALWLRVVDELRSDGARSNREIARLADVSHALVASVRHQWDAKGELLVAELDPYRRTSASRRPSRPSPAGDRVVPEGAVTAADRIAALEGSMVEMVARLDRLAAEVRRLGMGR
jgi:hypothetical protein